MANVNGAWAPEIGALLNLPYPLDGVVAAKEIWSKKRRHFCKGTSLKELSLEIPG
jgi:hypothetical protein